MNLIGKIYGPKPPTFLLPFKNRPTYRIEYLVEVIIVGIADVGADNFIASLALETVLYIMGTEAPNRFARNDAKQDVIVTAHVYRIRSSATATSTEISAAESRSGATTIAGAPARAAARTTSTAGCLVAGVRRGTPRVARH